MKNRFFIMMLSAFLISSSVMAHKNVIRPGKRSLDESELSAKSDFQSFRHGPNFMDQFFLMLLLGYFSKSDLISDFLSNLNYSSDYDEEDDVEVIEDELCSGQTGETESTVKLTFDCSDDGIKYSCYADLNDGKYSIEIPDDVKDLTCKIQVEKVEVDEESSTVDVEGVETEEVELSDDSAVVVDVE
jgi:hypothetical protein